MKSVTEILVMNLKKWGVDCAFGIPGKPLAQLVYGLEMGGVKFVLGKHEGGSGYAAAGYALMNRKLGVAIGTSGPGGTNLLTAAGQAKASHAPVLFITGQQSIRDTGKALGQDSTFFGTDVVKMFEPVTKFSARVERADLFKMYLQHALEKAHFGVKGPVHLSIPSDILVEQIEEFEIDLPIDMPKTISQRLDEVLEKLDNAKRPVILAGKGVHSSDAYKELLDFAEQWNIKVMTTPGGKGTFVEKHPLSLGAFGLGGTEKSSEYMSKEVDLMIVIGSKLTDMSLAGLSADNFPKELIHMDGDPTFIKKAIPVSTISLVGDIKANLQEILKKAGNKEKNTYKLVLSENEVSEETNNTCMLATDAVKIIRQELSDDTIVFGDDGSHSFYAIQNFEIRQQGTFFFDDVFGAMGHAIGYAIGAQIANRDKKIVCFTGDGCTFMHGTEISTAVNNNLPITFIVINNCQLDMAEKGMRALTGTNIGTTYDVPLNASKLAEALGSKSFKCKNQSELRVALKAANEHKETIVIEIMVDPLEMPPTLKRR